MKSNTKQLNRARRHARIRVRLFGTARRPRLSVFRSNTRVKLQLIDDNRGVTLVANESSERGNNIKNSFESGKKLAELASVKGIKNVVFDRGGYKYHGRVKAVAEGARAGGLIL